MCKSFKSKILSNGKYLNGGFEERIITYLLMADSVYHLGLILILMADLAKQEIICRYLQPIYISMHYADSCQDVLIENCYISVGDDAIAIKSGWDQYGIAYGRPSSNILIRNVTVRSLVRYTFLCQQYACALVFCFSSPVLKTKQ